RCESKARLPPRRARQASIRGAPLAERVAARASSIHLQVELGCRLGPPPGLRCCGADERDAHTTGGSAFGRTERQPGQPALIDHLELVYCTARRRVLERELQLAVETLATADPHSELGRSTPEQEELRNRRFECEERRRDHRQPRRARSVGLE